MSRSSLLVPALLVISGLTSCADRGPTSQKVHLSHLSTPVGAVAPTSDQTLAATLEAPATLAKEEPSACPDDMVLVEGSYCPDVEQRCLRWMDPPGRYHEFRCAQYAQPATCRSAQRVKLRFCMDRDEYTAPGSTLPENDQSFNDAVKTCGSLGKRVCQESEWNFACEGEEMRPYPYGFARDATACNADHTDLVDDAGKLKDRRAPSDAYPRCVSPFGVRNLSGNLEEMVAIDGTSPVRPAMKGAYWQPSRNFCRAAQTAHDAVYHGTETGFRCCSDPE
ncbi:MAG: SUMF1/EgtB/PvdO family nonheme iron enzyme [Myxococcales bacterium]|nr:SUMF1/EgtB/PvdO family nonheme iron enzyme [Myxococcales bacterium]MCB9577071.1 SUMF1/EgtB/PvdO family nonheme iron enzyme [Polyangiaceae bacterium]